MGDIVGGLIGGIGSLFGGSSAKSNDLTGYNYLTGQNGQPGVTSIANNAVTSNNAATGLLTGTATPAQNSAFNNYLNSTGYQFQQQQGANAITGSAAARGILNSGSTGKALQQYGQGLAGGSFNNYLGQLGGLTSQGLTASGQIGQAGTSGGVAAGNNQQSAISSAGGQFGNMLGNVFGGI